MKKEEPKENNQNTEPSHNTYWQHKEYKQSKEFGGAFVLIIIGTLFLLNNFGFLPWSVWADLWRFWPLFLIFWGFQMIFGKSKIANILLLIISLLVVGYFILNTVANNNSQFNEYLKQKFPIWQNLYRYTPPISSNQQEPGPPQNRRPSIRRPSDIDFGDEEQEFNLP